LRDVAVLPTRSRARSTSTGTAKRSQHDQALLTEELRDRLRKFAAERDWQQFHTPKNLTAAIAGEAGELAAVLQWAAPDADLDPYLHSLEEEIADVLIYLIRLSDVLSVDLLAAANAKIERNGERYPPLGGETSST
jgi:NTP pyrophosphatase (non-canonical NTP hydrolase)